MEKPPLIVPCPTCKKSVAWTEKFPQRPFCSERCRLIDLGAWADEGYVIPVVDNQEDNQEGTDD